MKKIIYSLFALVAFTLGAITLTACGDDDNGGSSGGGDNPSILVGTWSAPNSSRTTTVTLNSNGSGLWEEFSSSGLLVASGTFRWSFSGNTLYLNWISGDTEGAPTTATLSNITSNSFTCVTNNPTKTYNFTKDSEGGGDEGGSSSDDQTLKNNFVGTWRIASTIQKTYVNGVEESTYADAPDDRLIVSDDGTITYMEKGSSGSYHEDGVFTYSIINGEIVINSGGDVDHGEIHSLTNTELDLEIWWKKTTKGININQKTVRCICYKMP